MESYLKHHDSNKQVSTTGARALVILVSLVEGPKTFTELRDYLIDCGVATKEYSVDTIRIDLNTLKMVGCVISKATKTNKYSYKLESHPFLLNVEEEEIEALREVYERIAKKATPKKLLDYHNLFLRIAEMVSEEKIKQHILGVSLLKSVNTNILRELVVDEKCHNKIKILYKAPNNNDCEYDITVEKLGLRNDKLYVYCFNHSIGKRSFLNVDRIKKIVCKLFDRTSNIGLDTAVKFKLLFYKDYVLDDNETIIEENDSYTLVEGRYYNEFIAVQRMLSFGPDCIVVEPSEIKEEVIAKLKEMRSVYDR